MIILLKEIMIDEMETMMQYLSTAGHFYGKLL